MLDNDPLLGEEHIFGEANDDPTHHHQRRHHHPHILRKIKETAPISAVFGVVLAVGLLVVGITTLSTTTFSQDQQEQSKSTKINTKSNATLSVTPDVVSTNTWVEVQWSGVDPQTLTQGSGEYICTQDSYCKTVMELNLWVGLFGENDNIDQIGPQDWPCGNPPWLATAPIKWKPLNSTSGSVTFILESNLENVRFHLFGNGSTYPTLLASSQVVKFTDLNKPFGVHLARTYSHLDMRVSWQSNLLSSSAKVRWGYSSGQYTTNTTATPTTYTSSDLCGPPATTHGWKDPGYFYTAVLSNLRAGEEVFYVVGSDDDAGGCGAGGSVGGCWSLESSFRAPVESGADQVLRITAIADMGETYIDGAQYHWMEPYAINTTNGMIHAWDFPEGTPEMRRLALNPHKQRGTQSGRTGPPQGHTMSHLKKGLQAKGLDHTDLVLHIGDIAYATGYESEWDRFMRQIEPIASRVAYMTGQGNHERDYPSSGDAFGGGDSGGECGVPTETRFTMPTPSRKQDSAWYSFNQGPVHFVMMDTEMAWRQGSTQYAFLEADLAAVDRSVTPWVIFMGHRPMYFTNVFEPVLLLLEPLLFRYQVDLCLWGHVHNAQQTCPVLEGACVTTPTKSIAGNYEYYAPVHAVIGNAGQSLTPFPSPRAAWSLYEASEFGFSTIEVLGSELLVMKFFGDLDGSLHHTFNITRKPML